MSIRFALRLFARRPGVPLLVAALFALGVGLGSGMWAVVDAALLRPLPYRDGAALVAVMETHPQRGLMAVTPANFLDWSTRVRSLQDAAGVYALDVSVAGAGAPERVSGTKVTQQFFDLWGVPPALGRVLQRNDFAAGGRVVVLGRALWARHFNGDVHALGALLRIDGEAYTVVGVMPASFRTIDKAEIWIPWMMSAEEQRERRFHLVGHDWGGSLAWLIADRWPERLASLTMLSSAPGFVRPGAGDAGWRAGLSLAPPPGISRPGGGAAAARR